jgi:hypothetical protein
MVPPVQVNAGDAIKRVGAQKTYLFYRDGIESFVVRPGFEGKVDNFGMLIPFPNVPSIRKVPNNIFPQLTKAIDPPEITVRANRERFIGAGAFGSSAGTSTELNLKRDEVQVKSTEAVGMYQTAVLEAGSPEALKRWMDDHGYSYPNNMGQATQDYVDAGWCFVAVKARVGSKNAVNPKPGMREADTQMPEDATFDGNVQAMGFRFRTDELVAPMRLSAYNSGKLHNITYVLTDEPKRINHISKHHVKRQVSGDKLYRNVTEPLPVRVIGEKWEDLSDSLKEQIREQRDPDAINGRAKELFQGDLLAARNDQLVLGFEQEKKALLDIEEALNLRGEEVDALNREYLSDRNKRERQQALKDLKGMTLTVVDGVFPREVLKRENLTFSTYRMPADRNRSSIYNARLKGPVNEKKEGQLYQGKTPEPVEKQGLGGWFLLLILGSTIVLYTEYHSRSSTVQYVGNKRSGSVSIKLLLSLLIVSGVLLYSPDLTAQIDVKEELQKLTNRDQAPAAVKRLVNHPDAALPELVATARDAQNIRKRGWAIVALSRIGGKFADAQLKNMMFDGSEPDLVRTLAAAGRIRLLNRVGEMKQHVDWINRFPALARPFRLRFQEIRDDSFATHEFLLSLANLNKDLRKGLTDQITRLEPAQLTDLMLRSGQTKIRRTAAAYLGTIAESGKRNKVSKAIRNALRFSPDAEQVPWQAGPLFLPRLDWTKSEATSLVHNLMSWMVYAQEQSKHAVLEQIENNLRSRQLLLPAGYEEVPDIDGFGSGGFGSSGIGSGFGNSNSGGGFGNGQDDGSDKSTSGGFGNSQSGQSDGNLEWGSEDPSTMSTVIRWLESWKSVKGTDRLKSILAKQDLLNKKPYRSLLEQ